MFILVNIQFRLQCPYESPRWPLEGAGGVNLPKGIELPYLYILFIPYAEFLLPYTLQSIDNYYKFSRSFRYFVSMNEGVPNPNSNGTTIHYTHYH